MPAARTEYPGPLHRPRVRPCAAGERLRTGRERLGGAERHRRGPDGKRYPQGAGSAHRDRGEAGERTDRGEIKGVRRIPRISLYLSINSLSPAQSRRIIGEKKR